MSDEVNPAPPSGPRGRGAEPPSPFLCVSLCVYLFSFLLFPMIALYLFQMLILGVVCVIVKKERKKERKKKKKKRKSVSTFSAGLEPTD